MACWCRSWWQSCTARGAGCSWSSRVEVDIEVLDDNDDEVVYSDESVKYDESNDKSNEVSRVVDEEEINSTVSNHLND